MNYELKNDTSATVAILTKDNEGNLQPVPHGDGFAVTSDNATALATTTGIDHSGNPTITMVPLVRRAANITVTVTDSAGLMESTQIVDIVDDVTPKSIFLDFTNATLEAQAVPAA